MDTFEKLLVGLSRGGVDYIVVGGLAVTLCGYTRMTLDLDLLVRASTDNVERLLNCLANFGEGAARELSPVDFTLEEGSIQVVEDFPVDLFTLMSGYTYEDMLPMTDVHEVEGVTIRHLNPAGLILLKAPSLRPKDQLDVLALRAIQRGERL